MMVVGTRPAITPRYSPLVVLGSAGKSTPKPYCGYFCAFQAAWAGAAAATIAANAKAIRRIDSLPIRNSVADFLLRRRLRSHRYVDPACLAGERPAPYKSASEIDRFRETLDEYEDLQPCPACGGRFRGPGRGASFFFDVRCGKDRDAEWH